MFVVVVVVSGRRSPTVESRNRLPSKVGQVSLDDFI